MTGENIQLMEHGPYEFRIEPHGEMQVPGIIYAAKDLLPTDSTDKTLQQVVNVATLPGIKRASFAMPDLHWGYGFPIGGVAATDIAAGGVISPGGVGFDISCGVRLLSSTVDQSGLHALSIVMDQLGKLVPRGPGPGGYWQFSDREELRSVLSGGSSYCVDIGQGVPQDLDRCEDGGTLADADPAAVSQRAMSRGAGQLGSLGSGNHFLEVQAVTEVEDPVVAEKFGLHPNQICVMIHCGSRGLGHQVCLDYVQRMDAVMSDYDIAVPDRQLACAPVSSPEGIAYLGAMNAAANYGRANRQMLTQAARAAFADIGAELDLVYDISHNMAKIESHNIDDKHRSLCVHRKGATRALPPGHADLSDDLRDSGQPILIPGSMGTASYVLTGMPGNDAAFHSTCHGAGRVWSRHQAMRTVGRDQLQAQLQRRGIEVRGTTWRGLVEEAPEAYKDIASVVDAAEGAGLARKVAKLEPIGVVKG